MEGALSTEGGELRPSALTPFFLSHAKSEGCEGGTAPFSSFRGSVPAVPDLEERDRQSDAVGVNYVGETGRPTEDPQSQACSRPITPLEQTGLDRIAAARGAEEFRSKPKVPHQSPNNLMYVWI